MNDCPYCQNDLPVPLKRKGTCPSCKKIIFVRNGKMVTEFDSKKIDWLKRIEGYGGNVSEFDNSKNKLTQEFKKEPLFNDVCWRILNELLGKYVQDQQTTKQIYYEMAHILETEGKDNSNFIIKANQIDLLKMKKIGFRFVKVQTCNDESVCVECKNMASRKIPIDVAIETNPIPSHCKNKFCRCSYGADMEDMI
jgi:hypothetical protein